MTIFGTMEFGVAVWQYNMVSNLAQEGARWASVRGTNSTGIDHAHAVQADVRGFVQGRSVGINPTTTTSPTTVGAPGSTISVTVTQTFTPLTALIPSELDPAGTAQMVVAW